MKKFSLFLLVLVLGVSCASYEAKKEVKAEAAEVLPVISPTLQYERAVAMIDANPELSKTQKLKLVNIIKAYGRKVYENRQKEGQYRTVLMDEILTNDRKSNAKIAVVKKNMIKLNKENSRLIEGFVIDFKKAVGKNANFLQPVMLEVIFVE